MTKSKGIGRGGARKGAGRKPNQKLSFEPIPENLPLLAKWESLGYKSQDDLINFCLAVVAKETVNKIKERKQ